MASVSVLTLDFRFDRASHVRSDERALEALFALGSTQVLRVYDGRFCWESKLDSANLFFLGIDGSNVAYFANHSAHLELDDTWTLRENNWSDLDRAIATHAVALTNWHASHPHCPLCGALTQPILSGAARRCVEDGSEHHPRSDPAVICLVVDRDERLLLGRQRVWPPKRFSAFAGFVEPGESLEACVQREVFEECNVDVESLQYLGSQPWPFPASLMVAFRVTAKNPSEARADGTEIEEIQWFTKVELKAAYLREEVLLPPRISIARRMIEHWYGSELHR